MTIGEIAVRVTIAGKVQGVSFRDWTLREADAFGLKGWVRNEADGTVSALIVGAADNVAAMRDRLWQGPSAAAVESVTVTEADPADAPPGFRITG